VHSRLQFAVSHIPRLPLSECSFTFSGGIRARRGSAPLWPPSQSSPAPREASAPRRGARRACEPRGRRRRVRIAAVSRAKFVAFFHADAATGKFPLTRAAARRSRERRERAIGRARIGYSASRAIETPPVHSESSRPPSSPRSFRADSVSSSIVSSVRLSRRIAKPVSIGRRKCDNCFDRDCFDGHVDLCRHGIQIVVRTAVLAILAFPAELMG